MDEKNGNLVQNEFSQARRSHVLLGGVWFGVEVTTGDFGFGCKENSTGLKRGPCLAFLPTTNFSNGENAP
jgi:hypothetical protein